MKRLRTAVEDKQKQKKRRKAIPKAAALARDQELVSATSDDPTKGHVVRLDVSQLPTAQRQNLAANIGQTQGNWYLQRVLASQSRSSKKIQISSFKFGLRKWENIGFLEAVNMVRDYTKAEQKASERLTKQINEEHWVASFWSEALGFATPPSYEQWITPIVTLNSAVSAYDAGRLEIAKTLLQRAVDEYNTVHKVWYAYRTGLESGAERAIRGMEITIVLLETGLTAGMTTAASSGLSAGISLYKETAQAAGKIIQDVEEEIDILKIVRSSLTTFVTSYIGGKFGERINGALLEKVRGELPEELINKHSQRLVKSFSDFMGSISMSWMQPAVEIAAAASEGRPFSMEQFLEEVEKALIDAGIAEAFELFLDKN